MSRYLITITTVITIVAQANPVPSPTQQPVFLDHASKHYNPPAASPASHRVFAKFEDLGRSGVPAMHAALLQNGKVVFLDKIETSTELKLENGRYAFSSIFDPDTQELVPLEVHSNAFCSAGAFLEDGRLISVGGNADLKWLDPTVNNGLDAIRYLDLNVSSKSWIEPGNKLNSNRWYSTAQGLADGSIIVASGSLNALDVTNKSNNNPTYEILDKQGLTTGNSIGMEILSRNQPY